MLIDPLEKNQVYELTGDLQVLDVSKLDGKTMPPAMARKVEFIKKIGGRHIVPWGQFGQRTVVAMTAEEYRKRQKMRGIVLGKKEEDIVADEKLKHDVNPFGGDMDDIKTVKMKNGTALPYTAKLSKERHLKSDLAYML